MVESEDKRIRDCVRAGRYEDALSVGLRSSRSEINRAHIKLLFRFRDRSKTREWINKAKSRITGESGLQKGRRLTRIGRKEEAIEFLEAALSNGGSADDFILIGQTLEQTWRTMAALKYFERAVELRGDATDHLWLGSAFEQLDRHAEAVDIFGKAVALRGSADDHLSLGSVLMKMKRFDDAQAHLEKALALGDDIMSQRLLKTLMTHKKRQRLGKLKASLITAGAKIRKRHLIWLVIGLAMSCILIAAVHVLG